MKKLLVAILLTVAGIYFFILQNSRHPAIASTNTNSTNKPKNEPSSIVLTFLVVRGTVTVEKDGNYKDIVVGDKIEKDCIVKTGENSLALLGYGKDFSSKIKIGPKTNFELSKYPLDLPEIKEGISLNLIAGNILLNIFNPSKKKILKVKTKTMAMGIRGTIFLVDAKEDSSLLLVKEGAVEMENELTQNIQFVNTETGVSVDHAGNAKNVNVDDYTVNWDFNSNEADFFSAGIGSKEFLAHIFSLITVMKNQIVIESNIINSKKNELAKLVEELVLLKKDLACLDSDKVECVFVSKELKYEVYSDSKKNGVLSSTKDEFKLKLNKLKSKSVTEIAELKSDFETKQSSLILLEKNYVAAKAKSDEYSSLNDTEKQETQKKFFNEIVSILDDANLTREYESLGQ